MRIIVDGCDGTGKSTLINFIHKMTSLDFEVVKFSYPKTKNAFEEFSPFYTEGNDKFKDNCIFDRCWISEIIYGPLKGRPGFTKEQINFFLEKTKEDLYIISHTSIGFIQQVFENRGETYIDIEQAKVINNSFRDITKILKNNTFLFYDVEVDGKDLKYYFDNFIKGKLK